jgi:prefoldin subunit 5
MRFGGTAAPFQRPDPESEKQALRSQAEALQSELELLKKRLSEMEGSAAQ